MNKNLNESIRIFLCDDHTLFRQGMKKLLELEEDIEIIGEANNGAEMLTMLKKTGPDVILMDINMPQVDGIAATAKVKQILPHVKIIMLTVYNDDQYIFNAIKAGAMGYLLKDASIKEVVDTIKCVYKNEALIQPAIAAKVLKEFAMMDKRKINENNGPNNGLTKREKEVLQLLTLGDTNKMIANKLGIAEKTVKNHISNIFQVLHVNNRTEAAIYALNKGPHLMQ